MHESRLSSDPTTASSPNPDDTRASPAIAADLPVAIGRYRVERLLGSGGYGAVYLAHDDDLRREVAVKVPRRDLPPCPDDVEAWLAEARAVARLEHPHIVPVYDVGRTDEGLCFFVARFIAGTDLRQRIAESRPSYSESAALAASVAEALQHAHRAGLVHRDVKPGNILLDQAGKAYLTDFGMALSVDQFGQGPRLCGTPAYMSPEQVRGEGHRVDGRSDIFSLGAVLYELLTGQRPFRGDTTADLLYQIVEQDPRPLRQWDEAIPKELERICLKALARRASDRYSAAQDLADDLRTWLARGEGELRSAECGVRNATESHSALPTPNSALPRIVPKGLRSFDAGDADFFLELLPGPRDRQGLPDSLRFWKTRLEETDADQTFPVGVLCGPSGCGKSSLVKAGLLPRLATYVQTVYVEATSDKTEVHLLKAVRKIHPGLPADTGLKDALADLRRRTVVSDGAKLLIVLDQFEQWLHGRQEIDTSELVAALRQCDGGRVQCLVLVRDDFWMGVIQFMQALEVRLVEGHNSAAVDLFDARHARKVLAAFGRACGAIPETLAGSATSAGATVATEQDAFLNEAVAGLSEQGKIVCVRLALFAQMMRGRPWDLASLRKVGGAAGVGVSFLEEVLGDRPATPANRYHQLAARRTLEALLPHDGTDIKGHLCSRDELLTASGYAGRLRDFEELLSLLDSQLRLITPTESGESRVEGRELPARRDWPSALVPPLPADARPSYYQLTHDYLVPSLRDWLTRKRRETRRGRAELRLAERAAAWSARRDDRHLPSWWEWLTIRLYTRGVDWTGAERQVMRQAGRKHAARWSSALALLLVGGLALGYNLRSIQYRNSQARAETLVETALGAPSDGFPSALENLRPSRALALPPLRAALVDPSATSSRRLRAACALAELGASPADFPFEDLATVAASECRAIVSALSRPAPTSPIDRLRALARQAAAPHERFRYAATALYLGDDRAASASLVPAPNPIHRTTFILGLRDWQADLMPVLKILRETDDLHLRSGLAAALGRRDPVGLAVPERRAAEQLLQDLYLTAPDSGTHCAAEWSLRQWSKTIPPLTAARAPAAGQRWIVNGLGMSMVVVPPGTFTMGAQGEAPAKDGAAHPVTLTRHFLLADREVTTSQFRVFLEDAEVAVDQRPSPPWEAPAEPVLWLEGAPVEGVNWFDALLFCNWLSQREGRTACYHWVAAERSSVAQEQQHLGWRCDFDADGYRLPTEAEWESACRAGVTTLYSFGDSQDLLPEHAIFYGNSRDLLWPAGTRLPNTLGLFDMHGGVWEWCWDGVASYTPDPLRDPTGPLPPPKRAIRGGGRWTSGDQCRCATRLFLPPWARTTFIGFRVAATIHD